MRNITKEEIAYWYYTEQIISQNQLKLVIFVIPIVITADTSNTEKIIIWNWKR